MRGGLFGIVALLTAVFTLSSCSVTRRVPKGSYLLTKNIVAVDKQTPSKERVKAPEVEKFIQPKPNRKFLGTNLYLHLYNMASPDSMKKGFFNRLFRKLGDPPVLLDTNYVAQSANYIHNYLVYSGFYDSEVTYSVDTTKRKKAKVTYRIKQNEPYRISSINYEFRDEFIRPIVLQDSAKTLLHIGDVLDGKVLTNEKIRISENLKNNGYYSFSLNNIEFVGDSTVGNYGVALTVIFKQYLAGYTSSGAPIYENNSIYRIRDIYINPDFDPMAAAAADSVYYDKMDTTEYRGLYVIYPSGMKPKVRNKILRKTVNLYPNYLYSAQEVQQAYSNIMRLGYYKNASITFDPLPEDTTQLSQVTYIGDEGSGQTTSERYMLCHINCIPSLTHSYKIELEGTTTSDYYGIKATLGYQNRNLFRGVELFEASVTGGYEFMRAKGTKGSFEVGGAISLSFPRFIFPLNVDRFGRRVNPRTKAEFSVNSQRRSKYHRTLSSASWGYSWSNRHKSSFVIKPIDLNLIKMNYLDADFAKELDSMSMSMRNSFRDRLMAGISGSFIYNTQLNKTSFYANSFYFRFNWETAGNLINGLNRLFSSSMTKDEEGRYYKIFGIRYAQYFRMDASISNKIMLGAKSQLAFRFLAGAGLPYSNDNSIPYDRLFYSGGGNSMRGWIARTLGPGTALPRDRYPSQTGNIKLEANAEFRFPVWGLFQGAVFFDLGNVWFLRKKDYKDEAAIFHIDRFYKQLGFNTGLGFRFDIGMAIIRFDWGIRLHDPNVESSERWIRKFRFSQTVLNFGVGYPF